MLLEGLEVSVNSVRKLCSQRYISGQHETQKGMGPKLMIFGGSGFIGSEVARQALSKGCEVEIFDLKPSDLGVRTVLEDISHPSVAAFDLSSYDLVLVQAAITSQLAFERDPERFFGTNVTGLWNILEACRRSSVPKVMFASSAAVYGNVRTRVTEAQPLESTNLYGGSKIVGEILVNTYSRKRYFESLILRYFNTYGVGESPKGDYKSIISIFLESIKAGGKVTVYGDGKQRRDFIHVKDVAELTLQLCEKTTGTFNIGSGKSTSWNEILQRLEEHGLEFKREYVPNPILDYQHFTEADITKLLAMGLGPRIPMESGIDELIGYYARL